MSDGVVRLRSVVELEIVFSEDVRQQLTRQYGDLLPIINGMKRPPVATICRVNLLKATQQDVVKELKQILSLECHHVEPHAFLSDVVCVLPSTKLSSTHNSLSQLRIPPPGSAPLIFSDSECSNRQALGWPMTHKVILCDRFCGEAVLRGSDIFVKGIVGADSSLSRDDVVAVYADIRQTASKALARGLRIEHYTGTCVFLGLGRFGCTSRKEMFALTHGVAVYMSQNPSERVGPVLPALSGVLPGQMMLQNLPSVLVGHALSPQQGDTILDMCAAPGGKTAHLASLVGNQATIVACDKSRKKMVAARELFAAYGASCVTPLVTDATKLLRQESLPKNKDQWKSVHQILQEASVGENGFRQVNHFFPESFDRILLDPPCSALGLRPKLLVTPNCELERFSRYQQAFLGSAVGLLKPGGWLTYSTCTINALENEGMVQHILEQFAEMELMPLSMPLGRPGLETSGLSEDDRHKVRCFDPHDTETDCMGFFIALFRKKVVE